MEARTIDEGAMDEKSGMNFSEYMALLSGNTDLLDKAKLEKRIASLEGERKSFNKGKRDSEFKLESKTSELRNNCLLYTSNNYFDLAVSNIPFGDIAVFDPEFQRSDSFGRRSAQNAIHNYFFLKGLDAVRDYSYSERGKGSRSGCRSP